MKLSARQANWAGAAAVVLYVAACLAPVLDMSRGTTEGGNAQPFRGYLAMFWAVLLSTSLDGSWYTCLCVPNPLAALTLFLWVTPYRRLTFALGLLAFVGSLSVLFVLRSDAMVGAYLWVASMGALALGSAIRWKTAPAQVDVRASTIRNPWAAEPATSPDPAGPPDPSVSPGPQGPTTN